MSVCRRREFLHRTGRLGLLATLGSPFCNAAPGARADSPEDGPSSEYLDLRTNGRCLTSLSDVRTASPQPGDVVLLRDLRHIAPSGICATAKTRGKWQLWPYRLADGQSGQMLAVDDCATEEGLAAVPPEFEIRLDLPGWYAIWFGVPSVAGANAGIDAALDTDPSFVRVWPERGTRKGTTMGPMGVEVSCYWKCAQLDGRSLRLRVPYGTFSSLPWGKVAASLSSLRLVRLNESQVAAYKKDVSNPATKRVIIVADGYSDYHTWGEPGKGIDARLVQSYRQSDVKMLFLQSPSTGVAAWPSKVTSLLGDDASDEDWKALRRGDRRATDYVRWAIANKQEGMKIVSQLCQHAGIEFHFSLRMNLFWGNADPFSRIINGRFWREHPELRSTRGQLDYGKPGARQFVVDLLLEVADAYDPVGVNLDFTRWPPVADPAQHDFAVLTDFIKEIRQALDRILLTKGRRIALSVNVVDGFHAGSTLVEQKIDLEAWLNTHALDFICVEAHDHAPYLKLARLHNTPYYVHQDNEPPRGWTNDPDWKEDHDPVPGEELQKSPHINNTLNPTEWEAAALAAYRQGADGVCIVNNFGGWRSTGRLGHVDEMSDRIAHKQIWGQQVGPAIMIR